MIIGRISRRTPSQLDRSGSSFPLTYVCYSTRLSKNTDWGVSSRRSDVLEFPSIELDSWSFKHLSHKQTANKMAKSEAIRSGHSINVIGSDQASSTRHVLYDNGRITRYMWGR